MVTITKRLTTVNLAACGCAADSYYAVAIFNSSSSLVMATSSSQSESTVLTNCYCSRGVGR